MNAKNNKTDKKTEPTRGRLSPSSPGVSARGHPERREGERHPHPTENDQGTPRGQGGDREVAVRVGTGISVGDAGMDGGTRGPHPRRGPTVLARPRCRARAADPCRAPPP